MDFSRCYGCMRELPAPGAVCPHCGYDNTNDPGKQPSHVLPCGTVLNGKFIIGRTLGQGGFGITYIGYDLNLEIPVCIKEYYPEGSAMRSATQSRMVYWGTSENAQSMKESRKSFVKEAQKAVKLRDLSHVVTVWDVFYENETAYIVMDYIEGETLKSRLVRTQKTLSEKECVELLTPVMEDLEKAHERGIIHRDIKPDNIMLTSDEKPMLLDMGAAKDLGKSGGSTRSSSTVVSQGFSPLEQYREKGDIGAWTDVYAMSATIYYCVTGKVPDAAIDRIIDDNVSFSAFTPAFAAVLRKGLIIRPENRIQTMDELLGELTAALSGQNPEDEARHREEQRRREEEARQAGTREQEERQEAAELERNYQRGKDGACQEIKKDLREEKTRVRTKETLFSSRTLLYAISIVAAIVTNSRSVATIPIIVVGFCGLRNAFLMKNMGSSKFKSNLIVSLLAGLSVFETLLGINLFINTQGIDYYDFLTLGYICVAFDGFVNACMAISLRSFSATEKKRITISSILLCILSILITVGRGMPTIHW